MDGGLKTELEGELDFKYGYIFLGIYKLLSYGASVMFEHQT